MNNKQLQRTLGLLRRTGDRGIVLDPASDEVFVLMDADSYEELISDGLPVVPKNDNDSENEFDDYVLDDLLEIEETHSDSVEKSVKNIKNPEEFIDKKVKNEGKLNFSDDWDVKKPSIMSEESLADVPHEEEEEEKFYLEPVE